MSKFNKDKLLTIEEEQKIAEIRKALSAATPGPWEWEGLQRSRPGTIYEPPEEYQPATIYVEIENHEVVSIAELHDPMYIVESEDEYDTGERYLGTANDNARLLANAPEWLQYLLEQNESLQQQVNMLRMELTELQEWHKRRNVHDQKDRE